MANLTKLLVGKIQWFFCMILWLSMSKILLSFCFYFFMYATVNHIKFIGVTTCWIRVDTYCRGIHMITHRRILRLKFHKSACLYIRLDYTFQLQHQIHVTDSLVTHPKSHGISRHRWGLVIQKNPEKEKQSKRRVQWFQGKKHLHIQINQVSILYHLSLPVLRSTSALPFGAFSPQHRSTKGIIIMKNSLPHFFSATVSPEVSWGKSRLLMFVCLQTVDSKPEVFCITWVKVTKKSMIRGECLKFWLLIDYHPTSYYLVKL